MFEWKFLVYSLQFTSLITLHYCIQKMFNWIRFFKVIAMIWLAHLYHLFTHVTKNRILNIVFVCVYKLNSFTSMISFLGFLDEIFYAVQIHKILNPYTTHLKNILRIVFNNRIWHSQNRQKKQFIQFDILLIESLVCVDVCKNT